VNQLEFSISTLSHPHLGFVVQDNCELIPANHSGQFLQLPLEILSALVQQVEAKSNQRPTDYLDDATAATDYHLDKLSMLLMGQLIQFYQPNQHHLLDIEGMRQTISSLRMSLQMHQEVPNHLLQVAPQQRPPLELKQNLVAPKVVVER
jgi:hypothetical protein